ncbi:helix-turn-helix transcriptional regulator [Arthrobacter sp. CAU 1506]|uniref:PadR family transcriptional regulator n=1 Tax=Arthrobacter sp. CAU 1506 TaxID=2560052 RepID=UPI0010AC1CDC|nr:PadR family transcriptional regulator [Arthrobacter sp. CAU 1506]TJY67319.1 helix-turn-helix transcriptional regulator [Arthrobacter sp. CAU 1506]
MDSDDAATLALHEQELRRGTIVLASLAACRTPRYGYALLSTLADAGFQIEANTLYPLLRRLEKQGLLKAEWNTDEVRPRKYYTLTDLGSQMADSLRSEWDTLTRSLTTLWKEDSA